MKATRATHSVCFRLLFPLLPSLMLLVTGLGPLAPSASANDGTWTGPLPGAAPPSRYAHTAIHDPVRDRMIVFGGLGEGGLLLNDVWSLSLAGTPTWTQVMTSGQHPTPRFYHTAVYDPVRDRMLVFGGWDRQGRPQKDVWALELAGNPSWDAINVSGVEPEPRYQHTAIYDPVRDRMVVVGGTASNNYYEEDVWALDLAGSPAWHELPEAPTTHWLHTAIYDPVGDRIVVFGGYSDGADPALAYETDQTWELSFAGGGAWSQLAPAPDASTQGVPDHRGGHTAVYDPDGHQMLIFGGMRHYPFNYLDDVWALTLGENPGWRRVYPAGTTPMARYNCSAIAGAGGHMVVFGGEHMGNVINDAWALSFAQSVSIPGEVEVARRVDLAPPRPNPARGETTLTFDLAQPARVVLQVFDSQGRLVSRVADAWFPAGRHAVAWRADDGRGRVVESGVYFVQMNAGAFRATRRMVCLR